MKWYFGTIHLADVDKRDLNIYICGKHMQRNTWEYGLSLGKILVEIDALGVFAPSLFPFMVLLSPSLP